MAVGKLYPSALGLVLILLGLQTVYGSEHIKCEELPIPMCAFSVSSSGIRCVLEKIVLSRGILQYQCQSSGIMAEKVGEGIESEECIHFCGLERMSVGVSTDSLMESHFSQKLCSDRCQNNCPNIIDLYQNLAAGEGKDLTKLCEAQRTLSGQTMKENVKPVKSKSNSNTSKFKSFTNLEGTPS